MPEGFGGTQWQNVTNIHPLGLLAVLAMGVAMLLVSRRWAVLPMLVVACFISSVQKITVLTLDFNLLRIMVLFAVTRIAIRRESKGFRWKLLDKVLIAWVASSMLIPVLRTPTVSTVVNRLGFAFDALGMYFVFRCLVRDWADLDRLIMGIIVISIPVMLFFVFENRTQRNVFAVFGGVSPVTGVREGRLRCQGAYAHPILAGCFWASLAPLCAAYWWKTGPARYWAVVGVVASLVIVVTCASSTPVLGVAAGFLGAAMFVLRHRMSTVRWCVVLGLISLHIVMKAPVWHLVARVSAVGGSTGYHRYVLINGAITHFSEWALLGTNSTAHWGFGAQDVTNQYILEGVRGGFLTLVLFAATIAVAFAGIGRLWRQHASDRYRLALSWALGVSLFVHCVQYIGVSYFGQITVLWYLALGIVGSASPVLAGCGGIRSTGDVSSKTHPATEIRPLV